jgi:aryl-alcohol dehydrogenase-like predicted oxidoreductase
MSEVPRTELAPGYSISRLLKGGWQLAGGHGGVEVESALADMQAFVDAGIDVGTIEGRDAGVEALIGRFLADLAERSGPAAAGRVQVHTKCVPDLDALPRLTRTMVDAAIDRSRARLGVETLDLVQLHWWDYAIPGVLEAVSWLDGLRRDGRIGHVGLTNFDTAQLEAIVSSGVRVVSHQVQYSVLDRRPSGAMTATCRRHGVGLLAYGALAGGFLSERWLGQPAPREPLENRSLVKYRLIIEESGGWDYLQALLSTMKAVADRHGATIGTVAIRWVLEQPGVAGVIVGARHRSHLERNCAATTLRLDSEDLARLAAVQESATGPTGDVYALERVRGGRHASIMRYDLQRP